MSNHSQRETQKANVELVAFLKKAHPSKSNKEIADLAKHI